MPWNNTLILLPLLGGFLFLDWCYYTRLRQQRLDGNRLIIESAFVGAILILITSVALRAFDRPDRVAAAVSAHIPILASFSIAVACAVGLPYFRNFPQKQKGLERFGKSVIAGGCLPIAAWSVVLLCYYPTQLDSFRATWGKLVQFDYSGTAVGSVIIGVLGAFLINFLSDYDGTAVTVAVQGGDYLLSLCLRAVQEGKPITFILSNRRAYTGYVVLSPNLKPESQISLILAVQGYLEKDSSHLKWESSYLLEWENNPVEAKRFIVTIPTRLIDHAHLATEILDRSEGVILATGIPVHSAGQP